MPTQTMRATIDAGVRSEGREKGREGGGGSSTQTMRQLLTGVSRGRPGGGGREAFIDAYDESSD